LILRSFAVYATHDGSGATYSARAASEDEARDMARVEFAQRFGVPAPDVIVQVIA
jgi:hypothetical protein